MSEYTLGDILIIRSLHTKKLHEFTVDKITSDKASLYNKAKNIRMLIVKTSLHKYLE